MVAGTLIGRREELARLADAASIAADGQAQVVVLRGPAGVGKTALLHHASAELTGWLVLWATGDEWEKALPYGVLDQIAKGGHLELSARSSRHELADPFAAGAALLQALSRDPGGPPLAIVIDDAHLADHPSLQALGFAMRRMRADRVLLLAAVRDDSEGLTTADRLTLGAASSLLEVRGLTSTQIAQLAATTAGLPLSPRAAERLRQHTDGNPLHVRALLSERIEWLSAGTEGPLPAPRQFAAIVHAHLAECSTGARQLVEACSVLGMRAPTSSAARLAGLADTVALGDLVDECVEAGLISSESPQSGREVLFEHALVRAAVYHGMGAGRRSRLHRAAADVAAREDERLNHRIAAAIGESDDLATDSARAAHSAATIGAWSRAASLYLAAVRLESSPSDRARHLVDAVECLLVGGEVSEAHAMRPRLDEELTDPAVLGYVNARFASFDGKAEAAQLLSRQAWSARAERPSNDFLSSRIASLLAMLTLNDGDAADAEQWARLALACDELAPTTTGPQTTLVFALAIQGKRAAALQEVAGLGDAAVDLGPDAVDTVMGRGVVHLWSDDLASARRDLSAAARPENSASMQQRIGALMYLADAEFRSGLWDDATAHAELGVSLAHDTGHTWIQPLVHSVASLPYACRGAWLAAEKHLAAASGGTHLAATVWACTAGARLAHARSDWAGVANAVAPLADLRDRDGVGEPGVQPWQHLHAEALIYLGRSLEAHPIVEKLEELAMVRGDASIAVMAARVRGALDAASNRVDAADDAFTRGLTSADGAAALEVALLQFARGSLRRRKGRRSDAANDLTNAAAGLESLGAAPYLERAYRELTACGLTPARRRNVESQQLTPQERTVAGLVASGMTNRQIAAELVLSPKTIEFHLGNVYTKLGITSRSQLAAMYRQ